MAGGRAQRLLAWRSAGPALLTAEVARARYFVASGPHEVLAHARRFGSWAGGGVWRLGRLRVWVRRVVRANGMRSGGAGGSRISRPFNLSLVPGNGTRDPTPGTGSLFVVWDPVLISRQSRSTPHYARFRPARQ